MNSSLLICTIAAGAVSLLAAKAEAETKCQDQEINVYFQAASDELTSFADEALSWTAAKLQGCSISSINVSGGFGAGDKNKSSLAQTRAQAVIYALNEKGVMAQARHMTSFAPNASSEIMNRKAQIKISVAESILMSAL